MTAFLHTLKEKAAKEDYLSHPLLNNFLVFLTIAASTTQLSKHFWPESAFVYGLRVDYLAPSIFLLDILVILSLITKSKKYLYKGINKTIPLILFLALATLTSTTPLLSLILSLRLTLYVLFILALSYKKHKKLIIRALLLSFVVQLVLALKQFVTGEAGTKLTYWLGERHFYLSSPNVARASLFGKSTLRPYGTFPHPNALSGWLIAALLILHRSSSKFTKALIPLTAILLFLTNSRLAILSFTLFLVFYFLPKKPSLYISLAAITSFTVILLLKPGIILRDTLSLTERLNLQLLSLKLTSNFPLFGVGFGASIFNYPKISPTPTLTQPDHNTLTLLFSYFGIFGLILALIFRKLMKAPHLSTIIILAPLLLADHYFITSIQGLFVFLLLLKADTNASKSL